MNARIAAQFHQRVANAITTFPVTSRPPGALYLGRQEVAQLIMCIREMGYELPPEDNLSGAEFLGLKVFKVEQLHHFNITPAAPAGE